MGKRDEEKGPATDANGAEANIDAPAGLKRHAKRAEKIGRDENRLRRLLSEAGAKAAKSRDRLGDAWGELQTLFRLLKAWVTGQYRDVPWRVIVIAIAAVLYFVNPFDLIPDFLGIGLLDDIGVVAFAMSQMKDDLAAFREWEKAAPAKARA